MGRKGIEVTSLYNCTIENLKKIRNSSKNEFARNVLTAVIMRYEGNSTIEMSKFLSKTKVTIIHYIKSWNSIGLKSLKDWRGTLTGGTFTAEMKDDLVNTVLKNIWNKLKNCIFSTSAFKSLDELFDSVNSIYIHLNEDFNMVKPLVYARNYYS